MRLQDSIARGFARRTLPRCRSSGRFSRSTGHQFHPVVSINKNKARNFVHVRQSFAENVESLVAGQHLRLVPQPHQRVCNRVNARRVSLAFAAAAIKDTRHWVRLDFNGCAPKMQMTFGYNWVSRLIRRRQFRLHPMALLIFPSLPHAPQRTYPLQLVALRNPGRHRRCRLSRALCRVQARLRRVKNPVGLAGLALLGGSIWWFFFRINH